MGEAPDAVIPDQNGVEEVEEKASDTQFVVNRPPISKGGLLACLPCLGAPAPAKQEMPAPLDGCDVVFRVALASGLSCDVHTTSESIFQELIEQLSVHLEVPEGSHLHFGALRTLESLRASKLNGKHIKARIDKDITVEKIGIEVDGSFYGGVTSKNGAMYFKPLKGPLVLRVDPKSHIVAKIGPDLVDAYGEGVHAPNGCIYFAPNRGSNAVQIMRIHERAQAVETVGADLPGTYGGGILSPNGKSIYFVPCSAQKVLKMNTEDGSMESIGPVVGAAPTLAGVASHYASPPVLGPDGRIYVAPCSAAQVLRIDPETDGVDLIGPELRGLEWWASSSYTGAGVCAENGRIYFAPCDATHVLCIDPANEAVDMVGANLYNGQSKFLNGVHARNGKIYFAPRSSAHVLCIDGRSENPATSVSLIGPAFPSNEDSTLFGDGIIVPSGKIFFPPLHAARFLCVDPETQNVELIGIDFGWVPYPLKHAGYFCGGVQANGFLYFAPCDKSPCQVARIDIETQELELVGPELGPYRPNIAHFGGGCGFRSDNGKIYFAPCAAFDQTLCIDP